jgi:hypothetical protein
MEPFVKAAAFLKTFEGGKHFHGGEHGLGEALYATMRAFGPRMSARLIRRLLPSTSLIW